MEIKNLKDTPMADVVAAISESFADYFVPMPGDLMYWEKRFKGARVNLELSFGMFDQGKLVGFIINGVDELGGYKTAFNTGTGVTQSARGHGVTEKLYQYAMPVFKAHGIQYCSLEVIEQNERALHVYSRIGFKVARELKCFKGEISLADIDVDITEIPFSSVETLSRAADAHYSWDHTSTTIKALEDAYKTYKVSSKQGHDIGFFVINPGTGYLAQMEPATDQTENAMQLLAGVASVSGTVKVNNVAAERKHIITALEQAGLDNFINQYEMQMPVE
jgi:ribosomal protein S18 acetylase RimI-like enzyme